MRATYVSLSFVLCAVVIVGSCPLHQLEVDSSAVGEHSLISSFQSPQKESIMGGLISRNRRREDKEKDSPRLEPIEAEPDQNENEVDEHKKRSDELELNTDDGDEGEQVDPCETSPYVPTTFDVIDSAPSIPLYPSLEGMDLNVGELDSSRQMKSSPCHSDAPEEETKMENTGGLSEVSHSEAEVKEGEVGQAKKERNQRSSPMFPDNEEDITVDVSNQSPVLDSSLYRDEEPTFLQEKVIEINIDEPEKDRLLGSSSYRPGVILGPVLIDEEPEIIVDVRSEVPRPAFDPSLHLMAEPVIYHPQPVPIDDIIELEMAIDDELVKRKKRTLQKSNNVHPESKESQLGLDDEDLIDSNVGMYRQKKRARKIPHHKTKTLLENPI